MTPPVASILVQSYTLIPVAVSLLACLGGVWRANTDQPDRIALLVALMAAIVVGFFVAGWREPGVTTDAFISGVVLGATAIGALPVLAYYWLGRVAAGHRFLLAALWLASLLPLVCYLILAGLVTADLAQCPPDAYECPV